MEPEERPEAEHDATADETEGSATMKKTIIVLLVALLPALGGALLAYSQYDRLVQTTSAMTEDDADEPIEYGHFHEMENIIVNPADTGGGSYLMSNIGFESGQEVVLEEIQEKEVVIRDAVLDILSGHTSSQLAAPGRRDSLKQALRSRVNSILQQGEIDRLYFTQYVLQ